MVRHVSRTPLYGVVELLAAIVVLGSLTGCSLVNIETPSEPLTRKEVNARILTHDFATRFANSVELAADSIIKEAEDFPHRVNALRWKIGAYTAIREAALRESPTVGMIGTWALCVQMQAFFQEGLGDTLFGDMHHVALEVSDELEIEIDSLVRSFTTPEEYNRAGEFVRYYAKRYPFEDLTFRREPVIRAWNLYMGVPDSAAVKTVGDLPQTVTDLASRVNIQTTHLPKETLWQIQMLLVEAGLAGPEARDAIDSLRVDISKFADLAEASPEMLDSSLQRLSRDLEALLASVDRQRKETLEVLSIEREAVTVALQGERVAIMDQLGVFSQVTLDKTYAMLRDVVNSALLYGIIFSILVLSIPFAIGYIVGKVVGRRSLPGGGER
jgi:hypothetical protein